MVGIIGLLSPVFPILPEKLSFHSPSILPTVKVSSGRRPSASSAAFLSLADNSGGKAHVLEERHCGHGGRHHPFLRGGMGQGGAPSQVLYSNDGCGTWGAAGT